MKTADDSASRERYATSMPFAYRGCAYYIYSKQFILYKWVQSTRLSRHLRKVRNIGSASSHILSCFTEVYRAAKIVHQMAQAHASEKGAIGLDLGDGQDGKEMIDAPMLKQVCHLHMASAGIRVSHQSVIGGEHA